MIDIIKNTLKEVENILSSNNTFSKDSYYELLRARTILQQVYEINKQTFYDRGRDNFAEGLREVQDNNLDLIPNAKYSIQRNEFKNAHEYLEILLDQAKEVFK